MGTPDYELYYAMIEGERLARPVTGTLNVPVEALPALISAAMAEGVTTEEFVEIAVLERLEKELGLWPYVILSRQLEPCFFCGEPTLLVDLGFEAPFCNSGICNWAINEDLRMLTI